MRIGVVCGVTGELAAIRPDLPRDDLGGGVARIVHAGHELLLASFGIGKVAAGCAAGLLAGRHGAELLLVTGTAGALDPAAEGGCFLVTEAVQSDYGARRPEAFVRFTAGEWPMGEGRLSAFRAMPVAGTGLPEARIATGDLFLECGIHAAELRSATGAALVDMETAAVAQAAAILGLPWVAVKAATDKADDASAARFQANFAAAARRAALAAEAIVARF